MWLRFGMRLIARIVIRRRRRSKTEVLGLRAR
jgi:hypothetical protein